MENVYFVNNKWFYTKKIINADVFMISYEQAGGYSKKEHAEAELKRNEEKYNRELSRIKKITNINYTFREFIEYWLNELFIPNTESVTKVFGVWAVQNLILPHLERDIILSFVTPDYINEILERCIPVCDTAGESALKYLRKILGDAYVYGFLKKDIRNELMDIPRKQPRVKILNKEQTAILLQAASRHPEFYYELLLALFAGLRSGEIRGLRYDDFDPESLTIRVSRQYTSNYVLSSTDDHFEYSAFMEEKLPKKNSCRLLRVPAFLFDELEKKKRFNQKILENRRIKGDIDLDEDYIALSPFGKIKKKGTLCTQLKRLCVKTNIPPVTFHALRHQFATMLIEKGVPLEQISKLMGHKNVSTTFNIYCSVMNADEDAREALNEILPVISKNKR